MLDRPHNDSNRAVGEHSVPSGFQIEKLFESARPFPAVHLYTGAAREVWDTIVNQPSQRQYFAHLPFSQIAADIAEKTASAPVLPVWLGIGSGANENLFQRAFLDTLPVTRAVVHEIDPTGAKESALEFKANFPGLDVIPWSGTFQSLEAPALHSLCGAERVLFGLIGATLSNFPDMSALLSHLGTLTRPGDLLLVDFLHVDRQIDRRWPKSGILTGDAASYLSAEEMAWAQAGVKSFLTEKGLSADTAPSIRYQVHEFPRGFGAEIIADFPELGESLSLVSFIRCEPDKFEQMLHDAGFELVKRYNPITVLNVALAVRR